MTLNEKTNTYDSSKLAELSRLAIGNRTLREFASLSGLSEGFLSRMTTGKLKSAPTRRSITKLVAAKPQNGITMADLMDAAGYNYSSGDLDFVDKIMNRNIDSLPPEVLTATFPTYFTAMILERSGQISNFSSKNQKEMFEINVSGKKTIVGIPAFCEDEEVDKKIQAVMWTLLMARSIYSGQLEDKFILILTNQPQIYKNFDNELMVGTGGEFHIALTEDFRTVSQQRPIQAIGLNGKHDEWMKKSTAYNLVTAGK